MDISGTYTLNAPRERVWDALLDPDMLQRTIPGCEKLEQIGPDEWRMRVTIGIAAVKGSYEGTLRMTDRVAPEHYRLVADGTGARSVLHGDGTLSLEEKGPSSTLVTYKGEAQINGPLAGIANRVAGSVSRMLVNQFFGRFQKEMDAAAASAPPSAAPEAAPEATSAAPAAAVAATHQEETVDDSVFDASTSGVWEMSLPEARPLGDEQMPSEALPLDAAPAATPAATPSASAAPTPTAAAPDPAPAAPAAPATPAAAPAAPAPVAAAPAEPAPEPAATAAPVAAAPVAAAPTTNAAPVGASVNASTPAAGPSSSATSTASAGPAASRGGFMGWVARLFGRAS